MRTVASACSGPDTERDQIPVTAVLWDIDGTLLTSGGVAVQAFLDAVEEVAGRRPDARGLDLGGRIDPEIASVLLADVGSDDSRVPEVLARLHEIATSRADVLREHVTTLPGVVEALTWLAALGVRQSVVTGNIESVGMLKLLAAAVIPPIEPGVGGFGDDGRDRVEVARSALDRLAGARWKESPREYWIIGDTPRDLHCAQTLGLRCALVGTGRHSVASMASLGADVVVSNLANARELFALWSPNRAPTPIQEGPRQAASEAVDHVSEEKRGR